MAILHNMYRMRNIWFLKWIFHERILVIARSVQVSLTASIHPAPFNRGSFHGQA